jgi:glycosyltransferase involved in cell wall biosynthesis
MKILLVNKYNFIKGGAEKHFFMLKELLESHGHTVVVFAMKHPKNQPSPYEKYFVSFADFEKVSWGWKGLQTALRTIYSWEARRKMEHLIKAERPDIAHIHNIYHQISPSILPVLKKYRIPVVQTLHDYKLISPNYSLYHDGQICEITKGGCYYRAVGHKCVKGSRAASLVCAIEMHIHKLFGWYENNVDAFIAPSRFLMDKVKEWRTRVKKIIMLPYFINKTDTSPSDQPGDYFLFFGRLSEEKGVPVLLRAMKGVDLPLRIVGTGPEEAHLKAIANEIGLPHIQFMGFQSGQTLTDIIRGARAVIVPSLWYENCPLVIQEAYQQGRPVVATDLGGMKENVTDGVTGRLFKLGSAEELTIILKELVAQPDLARTYGRQAFEYAQKFDADEFYKRLMELYESLVQA